MSEVKDTKEKLKAINVVELFTHKGGVEVNKEVKLIHTVDKIVDCLNRICSHIDALCDKTEALEVSVKDIYSTIDKSGIIKVSQSANERLYIFKES
ncbi:hypothetical protein [Endozoicomonas sp. ONNA1]|uniref:hypothetical protein n=1 Tax=Endozoicomonas sp. ONNA1 TaxID=2828740 RepID=UPI00214813C4|nr:hypothetical protein [Endozoicomonas sp. ONNA1]